MRGITTKITRPRADGSLARLRLFRLLDRADGRQVLWISAPAGSGKTTLATTWIGARRIPGLWYALDAGDGDLATFFHFLARASPARGGPLPPLTPDRRQGLPVFTQQFFENLGARLPQRALLVFDNHHEVPATAGLDSVLQAGMSSLKPGQRLMVISRQPPSGGLASLLARGALQHIGQDELRLTLTEARALARKKRAAVPDRSLRDLHQRTGGWAAGLSLLLERARRGTTETPAEVLDFLAVEHLDHLPEETRRVLARVSIPPRISQKMAIALGGDRAPSVLADLARRGSFVTRRPGPVYELNPLFRELLLGRSEPDAEAHRLAARTCAEEGEFESAADLLARIRDWPALLALAVERAPGLLAQGREETLDRWLSAIPEAARAAQPWAAFWQGHCKLQRDPPVARAHFTSAFEAFRKAGDPIGQLAAWPGAVASTISSSDLLSEVDPWIDVFETLPAIPAPPPVATAVMVGLIGAITMRRPQHPRASAWIDQAVQVLQTASGDPNLSILLGYLLIEQAFFLGAPARAQMVIERLRRLGAGTVQSQIGLLHAEAVCALQQGDCAASLAAVDKGLRVARGSGVALLNVLLHATAVRAGLIQHDLPTARHHLEQFLVMSPPGPRLHAAHYAYLAGWEALASGQLARALEQAVNAAGLAAAAGAPIPEAQCLLLEAEVQLERGGDAVPAMQRARAIARATGSHTLEAQCDLIDAQLSGSQASLRTAFERARRQGPSILLTFVARPETFARLCLQALEAGIEPETVRTLLGWRGLGAFVPPPSLESWPWSVRIRLCGRFALEAGGRPVTFTGRSQRRPIELLQILVALGGRDVREVEVADLMWPDAEGDRAEHALEITLHRLRAILGDAALVKRQDGLLTLDRARVFADVWAAEDLARRGLAVRLDGPFLPATSSDWAVRTRARLAALAPTKV